LDLSTKLLETSNFFVIFSLPAIWQIDRGLLDSRYRQLQREFHPDRYAAKGDVEKRLAVQTTSLINQAYETLKSPLKRAQYLLELEDIDAGQESHITSDMNFLMAQIEFRETLEDIRDCADPLAGLDSMRGDVEAQYLQLQVDFEAQHRASKQSASNYNDALDTVAKMQFFAKLLDEIEQREEELEDI
jgi:molecular chaperone HscB|tara:strand:- start:12972 stop:13535 length:564 start_codon:yes stop_codon:yes gene_type:complete